MNNHGDREISLLQNVMKESFASQRDLAKQTGLSLGLINFLFKNFIKDGLIQVFPLSKKKVRYQLTPQGLTLLTRRNYQQTVRTIRTYQNLKKNLVTLLKALEEAGFECFSIYGDGELRDLVEMTIREHFDHSKIRSIDDPQNNSRTVVLNATMDYGPLSNGQGEVINVLERILQ